MHSAPRPCKGYVVYRGAFRIDMVRKTITYSGLVAVVGSSGG